MHATWDTGMIEKHSDEKYGGDTQQWASALVNEIKTGSYRTAAAGWISCSRTSVQEDVKDILIAGPTQYPFEVTPLTCPIVWATEANAYNCVCVQYLFLCGSLTDEILCIS